MSFSFSLHTPKALPPLSPPCCRKFHLFITSRQKTIPNAKFDKVTAMGTISELQEIPSVSIYEVSLGYT
ncbi:hypothetical protein SLE2022_121580 [Rubroshorea leprosula]